MTNDGDVRLTGLDAGLFKMPDVSGEDEDFKSIYYSSPEQINQEESAHKDLFSAEHICRAIQSYIKKSHPLG